MRLPSSLPAMTPFLERPFGGRLHRWLPGRVGTKRCAVFRSEYLGFMADRTGSAGGQPGWRCRGARPYGCSTGSTMDEAGIGRATG